MTNRRIRKQVWVVMQNDYPSCVFDSEGVAENYCNKMNEMAKELAVKYRTTRTYYRWYQFGILSEGVVDNG